MTIQIRLAATLLIFAAALAGQAPAVPRPPAKPQAVPPAKSKPPISDAALEAKIRERFSKSKISVHGFQVRVQGGIATIDGKTDVIQHKGTATRIAKNAGAKAVNNRIQVSEAARQRAIRGFEKARKRAEVKRPE
jgi:osmotically-inducible protein OsmY